MYVRSATFVYKPDGSLDGIIKTQDVPPIFAEDGQMYLAGGRSKFVACYNNIEKTAKYIESIEALDKDSFEMLNLDSKERISNFWLIYEGKWDGGGDLHGLNYAGSIILSKKPEAETLKENNVLYMIYKVDCSRAGVEYSYYKYVRYANVGYTVNGDFLGGKFGSKLSENSWKPTGSSYYFYGYRTLEELYNLEIERQTNNYTVVEKNMVE